VSDKNPSQRFDFLLAVVILARVALIVVVWLGLFLAIFLGYFTVPIILIALLTIIYAVSDLGLYLLARKNKNGAEAGSGKSKELSGKD
jgi:apolipoprotein N-acyltransferase